MQLSFEITLAEFKSALKLYSRETLGRRIHWFIFDYVIPGVALVSVALALIDYLVSHSNVNGTLVAFAAYMVFAAALSFVVRRFRIRAMFRALVPPGAKSPVRSMEFSEEQILSTLEGIGEAHYLWTAIVKCVQNGTVMLLFISREQFLVIPQQILSPAQRAELNDLVARHVPARKP
jgi:YcxB-like protein